MNKAEGPTPHWPEDVLILAKMAKQDDLNLMAIGGTTRDFLRNGHLPEDLDFEICSAQLVFGKDEWKEKIDRFVKKIKEETNWVIQECPFLVFKIETINGLKIEISSPRRETFPSDKKNLGHSDFTAELLDGTQGEICFRRRDLTINAIGLTVLDNHWIDPLNGRSDFEKKILRPCSPEFYLDPVRFLRLVRFEIQFGFKFEDKLHKNLGLFCLDKLTTYYFFKEAVKVPLLLFLKKLYEYKKAGVIYPSYIDDIVHIANKNFPAATYTHNFKNGLELLWWTLWSVDWSVDDLDKYGKIFGGNEKIKTDLVNLFKMKEVTDEFFGKKSSDEWERAKLLKDCHAIYLKNQIYLNTSLNKEITGSEYFNVFKEVIWPLGKTILRPTNEQKQAFAKTGRPIKELTIFVYADYLSENGFYR